MFHGAYEDMVRFASEGELNAELRQAKAEFVERTGELFESDPSFERRLASFLEWYVLDRPVSFSGGKTPAQLYLEQASEAAAEPHDGPQDPKHDPEALARLQTLTRSTLSLFEFKRSRGEHMHIVDLLSGKNSKFSSGANLRAWNPLTSSKRGSSRWKPTSWCSPKLSRSFRARPGEPY